MSHLTVAASSKAFVEIFNAVRDGLVVSKSDSGNAGPFTWTYAIKFHLMNGSVQLNDDDTVEVKHLDVVWDELKFQLCFNLPGFCIGGDCIIPDPFDNCWVSLPKICIGGPVCIGLDLSGLVSEIEDVKGNLDPQYFVDPTRPPGVSDLTAEFLNKSNEWKIFLKPTFVDVLLIDVPATIENLIETVFKKAIEDAFSWIPSWAWSLLWTLLGPLLDLLKTILGIAEDIENWVEDLLNKTFNLQAVIETLVAQYFASQNPLFHFEDPLPILDGSASHNPIPVKIPLRNLASHVNSKEMIVTADIGA